MTASNHSGNGRPFVLVHGGFHGGWCFARVAEMLRAHGHRVFTPTLTGLGERSHLAAHLDVDCSLHVQDVVNVIKWEQLSDVVLCGHSYGGMVIGAAADRMPERVASLVYVDAVIPEDGKSVLDLVPAEQRAAITNAIVRSDGHGGRLMLPPAPAAAFNVNPRDRALVDDLSTPHPYATLCERLRLTGAHMNVRKKTFVRATRWDGASLQQGSKRIQHDRTWTVVEVPCGHDVMLDAPERLTEILLQAL